MHFGAAVTCTRIFFSEKYWNVCIKSKLIVDKNLSSSHIARVRGLSVDFIDQKSFGKWPLSVGVWTSWSQVLSHRCHADAPLEIVRLVALNEAKTIIQDPKSMTPMKATLQRGPDQILSSSPVATNWQLGLFVFIGLDAAHLWLRPEMWPAAPCTYVLRDNRCRAEVSFWLPKCVEEQTRGPVVILLSRVNLKPQTSEAAGHRGAVRLNEWSTKSLCALPSHFVIDHTNKSKFSLSWLGTEQSPGHGFIPAVVTKLPRWTQSGNNGKFPNYPEWEAHW